MSYLHCPYCEIKEDSKVKTIYSAIQPALGRCTDCGAYIDAGQIEVKVNGYADIYKGCLNLMEGLVQQFNEWLDFLDINIEDYVDDKAFVSVNSADIVGKLFVPFYGGTTKSNFMRSIGVKSESIEFELKKTKKLEQ